ncbi:hypothetical protein RsY01_1647 [Lactococcus reticulitermitis]|uniref:WxL domain-containing protein n=2 Tax=Pseudolactococcus reticulitermitis TaxID=2025039 RepID=A0A224XEN9_9LACT|nr:hypothetical protein RsY01_1647 [Lactococcus reticulitermitis]
MQRKNKFKLVTLAMLLALLPSMNFEAIYHAYRIDHVKPVPVSQVLSPQKVGAESPIIERSQVPTRTAFSGQSVTQPTRPNLPQRAVVDATAPSSFGWQQSISSLALPSNQVTAIQDGIVLGSYPATDAGVQQALYAMYSATGAATSDFVLYFGGNTALSNATAKAPVTAPTASNMTFSTLAGHAKSLTWVSNPADNLASSNTGQASGTNYTVTLPTSTNTNTYFGVPTVFRNVTVSAASKTIYAQGNAFATTNGSWVTGAVSIYGGTDSTDITGDTNLYIGATGDTAGWNIYGGNATGGTISGDTHVTVTQKTSSATFTTITGGNAAGGTIQGNTNLDIKGDINDKILSIFGGGVGTSASPVTVNGTVTTYVSSTNANARYQLYQGGVCYGNITGSIYNTLTGLGGWTGSSTNVNGTNGTFSNYNGGSYRGNIGTSGASNVISNSYDTSAFTIGQALFVGANGGTVQSWGGATNTTTSAQGLIYANITNYIKSAFSTGTAGAVYGVVGGNGHDSLKISPAQWGLGSDGGLDVTVGVTQAKAYAQMSASTVVANAQTITSNAIYGDIYTWMQSGAMSTVGGGGYSDYTSFSYGASSNGYLQGQSVLELGTSNADNSVGGAGVVYCTAMDSTKEATLIAKGTIPYSTTDKSTGNGSGWDLWGGGGTVWTYKQAFLQNGNSYLIHNNDVSRWTYGGQSNGSQIGNSYNILNGGIVDTLEGGGYTGTTRWGSTNAQVNMGQVNWFLSGGSWGDLYNTGNATVNVYNGTINAIAGGNYGQAGSETIAGNSTVNVYGGDFSGTPRDGTKQLCGGTFADKSAYILGNTTLNLDLMGPTGATFKLPTGTNLSGGGGYGNSNNYTGSGAANSINLKIHTNASADTLLNGAVVYGDGTTAPERSNVGTINLDINGDGNTIGSVLATNYTAMPTSGGKRYNTNIKIGDGTTITGTVSAGNLTDNLTDAIAAAYPDKQAVVTLGDNSSHNPITINGSLINFNSAEITAGTTVKVAGSFKNGGTATTVGNHAATYSKHGTIQIDENATLAVTSATSLISGSKLIVYPDATLSTPYMQTTGVINLSDLDMTTNKGNLFWEPTGTPPASINNTYSGAYWGTQKGFPVLTFNGGDSNTKSGAASITPGNFSGVDTSNNYAFLGDYTTASLTLPTNPTWIGYVIPGQIRVFNTTGLNSTTGNWQHHLSGVSTGTSVPSNPISSWASVAANTDASTIKLMYVMSYTDVSVDPFTFSSQTPAYIKSRTASSFDGRTLNAYPATNPNFDVNDPSNQPGATRKVVTRDYFVGDQIGGGNASDTYGSYIIQNVVTDDTTSLNAGDYILSTTEATSLTSDTLQSISGLRGIGVMSDLTATSGVMMTTDAVTTAINGLGTRVQNPTSAATNIAGKAYAQMPVTWHLGASEADTSLVVVPAAAVIASNHQTALNAYDAGISDDAAHDLSNQTDLDNGYTYARGFQADGTVAAPTLTAPADLIASLQTIGSSDAILDGNHRITPVTYSYGGLSKDITLSLTFGSLRLTAPASYDFGTLMVQPTPLLAWPQASTADVQVTDTRQGGDVQPWSLTVKQSTDLVGVTNGKNLSDYLRFKDGDSSQAITTAALEVHVHNPATAGTFNISDTWQDSSGKGGVYLNIPVQHQVKGVYQGDITWNLNDVPTN